MPASALRSKEFRASVHQEGSWGATKPTEEFDHVMDLHAVHGKDDEFLIEWACDDLDLVEHIGIWTEDGKLTDYDGVMSLPKEAAELLREHGIEVGDEFL